jgi:hypothetical protein
MPNYKFQEKLSEQRKNPETARAGLKWSNDEDNCLLDDIKEGVGIDEIAKKLQRTAGSIKTRLTIKAISSLSSNPDKSEEDINAEFGVSMKDIGDYETTKKNRERRIAMQNSSASYTGRRSNTVVSLSTIYSLLQEINNKLG